ncbi:hypothetical protein PCE31106_03572 [Pandoraea cepalis]|uniref:DUF112 domain-containing protein n=1 Tax=Pandoraea cepalis TaxID=2508294 RepID=A0A5E4X033_9BURK|nr:tripartite tricarboxylate transporter permease [Pandoraea cepalis]VVE29647.1 hypothetical protein PCE31106_03572 [Pandoraea cepalis]
MSGTLANLIYGFTVALQPLNIGWAFVGVLVGNLIGLLPGMGALSAISLLLPLTYTMHAVPAMLMLAGIFYGSQYGGAVGAILLNLPCHPPHAVTCLEGYPLTKKGRGGAALGIAMAASLFAAFAGIAVMIVASPLLIRVSFMFGPVELFAVMLLGLVAGGTLSRGSAIKGFAMTVFGCVIGCVGTDVTSGIMRFTFGIIGLSDKVELIALALGLFGVAEFLKTVNRNDLVETAVTIRASDLRPSSRDLADSIAPTLRGTLIGILFGAMPGTGPTITTFIAYAIEKRVSKFRNAFGSGAIGGVAAPEAASHSKTQMDFIPTLTLGIPGDAVMALLLGALMIQGIQPGPQLITEHPEIFWGLVASFFIGNIILAILNIPLIGIWVKILKVPYRFMYPAAIVFIAIGVYSANNSFFDVFLTLIFGIIGIVLIALQFPVAPILLGYVLGPMVEENLRRAMDLSNGNLAVFITHPLSLFFLCIAMLVIAIKLSAYFFLKTKSNSDSL